MFKYKSPLSRLLEGAGKPSEATDAGDAAPDADAPQPIADFNALRQVLTGGSTTTASYEDGDELIPEEKMPEFDVAHSAEVEAEAELEDGPVADDEQVAEDDEDVSILDIVDEPEIELEDSADVDLAEQVVTLRMAEADDIQELADAQTEEVEAEDFSAPEDIAEEDIVEEDNAEEEQVPAAPENEVSELPAEPVATAPVEEPAIAAAVAAAVVAEPATPAPAPAPTPQPTPAADRRGRVKTTFLGFERPDNHVQDLMEAAPAAKPAATQATFPVGWLVVTDGPGRGASVVLTEGLMQIGRNDDQAIQLDFGDTGISRSNHAVIAYDPEDRKCYLGHGGKANLVRLNGGPVLSTVPLSDGDSIRISETTMRFVAFCGDDFDWRDA